MSAELKNFNVQELVLVGDQGTCGGVNMADKGLRIVLSQVAGRRPVITLWDVIHNDPYMEEMKQLGLTTLNDYIPQDERSDNLVANIRNFLPKKSIAIMPAHGSYTALYEVVKKRECLGIDLTCQLVSKVQRGAQRAVWPVYVGITNHPETNSVIKRLESGTYTFVDVREIKAMESSERNSFLEGLGIPEDRDITFLSQTTLSPGDLREITSWLGNRFPRLQPEESICYAMRNRWNAVAQMTEGKMIDLLLVVGSKKSHNSEELRIKGEEDGIHSYKVDKPDEIDLEWFNPRITKVGLTSGASVFTRYLNPVKDLFLQRNPDIKVVQLPRTERDLTFVLPQAQIDQIEDFIQG